MLSSKEISTKNVPIVQLNICKQWSPRHSWIKSIVISLSLQPLDTHSKKCDALVHTSCWYCHRMGVQQQSPRLLLLMTLVECSEATTRKG